MPRAAARIEIRGVIGKLYRLFYPLWWKAKSEENWESVAAYFELINLPVWCRASGVILLLAVVAFSLNGFYAPLTPYLVEDGLSLLG
jgi:hypothetical protein